MAIATNPKLTIYRNLYKHTGPGKYSVPFVLLHIRDDSPMACRRAVNTLFATLEMTQIDWRLVNKYMVWEDLQFKGACPRML